MRNKFGAGDHVFEVVEGWGDLPADWRYVDVAGIDVDSADNVYVFNRGAHPIIVFDPQGRVLRTFGEGQFVGPHGIHVGPDDCLYCADAGDHTVKKYSANGRLLLTLGISGQASDTGYDRNVPITQRQVKQVAGPFNGPTGVALGPAGEIYVSDGYGNARVHKFSPAGALLFSWGRPGRGPGEFWIAHGIAVDREGVVYIADRENSRVQLFSPNGEYLSQWPWVYRPTSLYYDARDDVLFVSEFGYRAGPVPGQQLEPAGEPKPRARISVRERGGRVLAWWGEGQDECTPGYFFAPHAVAVDSRGDLYVGEVVYSAGQRGKLISVDCHALQKFRRAPGMAAVTKAGE
ncbi:MAG: peptidyl-alpha-hydroxyglycine alpha-amidating lyase family protein [Dehalococcoidales bacterium]|nr:peptidyl-alpha-hydroxyglycine alpha-amidating lyase family protein [Dehalococcoidales bacterium]